MTNTTKRKKNRYSCDNGLKHITNALTVSEQDFRTLAEVSPDCLGRHDASGRFVYVNPEWEKATKLPADTIIGKTILEVLSEPEAETYMNAITSVLKTGDGAEIEVVIPDFGGGVRHHHVRLVAVRGQDGVAAGVLSFGRDITERKRLDEEMIKADKLESLRILAGGIAHDFNNKLTVIMGHISIVCMNRAHDDEISKSLSIASQACQEATELSRRLISFAKGIESIKKSVDIAPLLSEALLLHGKGMKTELHIAVDLCPVEADEGQLLQVFGNLVVNASQAMPNAGAFRVEAEKFTVERNMLPELTPGQYVRIIFADEGCGIEDHVLPLIFEPYFTTKSQGTGLGLASSYLIISRHGGKIFVTSQLGIGSVFTVYLPAKEIV